MEEQVYGELRTAGWVKSLNRLLNDSVIKIDSHDWTMTLAALSLVGFVVQEIVEKDVTWIVIGTCLSASLGYVFMTDTFSIMRYEVNTRMQKEMGETTFFLLVVGVFGLVTIFRKLVFAAALVLLVVGTFAYMVEVIRVVIHNTMSKSKE